MLDLLLTNHNSRWTDDDAPGFGSSYANMETNIIPGNTFDFTYIHGQAIKQAGHPFVSVSDEAVMNNTIDINVYKYIDLILGEEKKTRMPKEGNKVEFMTIPGSLQKRLTAFCQSGGNLFISGAHLGTDLFYLAPKDTFDTNFAKNTLKFFWRTNYASKGGMVTSTDPLFRARIDTLEFNTGYSPDIYSVEAPDGLEPINKKAKVILRYTENNISAGIAYSGSYRVVVFGFPFETILKKESRELVMKAIFEFFKKD